jgi:hypothetical protein
MIRKLNTCVLMCVLFMACDKQAEPIISPSPSSKPSTPSTLPFNPSTPPSIHSTPPSTHETSPSTIEVPPSTPSTPLFPPPTSMPKECTSLISVGTRAKEKNECSGPYTLSDVEFYINGKVLAIKLQGKVHNLPGNAISKHSTILYSSTGITSADKGQVELEYQKWEASRLHKGLVSFYLTFWSGKKSELIVGELKELIEYIRKAFSPDKIPQGIRNLIHVELYTN